MHDVGLDFFAVDHSLVNLLPRSLSVVGVLILTDQDSLANMREVLVDEPILQIRLYLHLDIAVDVLN